MPKLTPNKPLNTSSIHMCAHLHTGKVASRAGLEPAIHSLEGCCIIHYATESVMVDPPGLEPGVNEL